MKAEQASTAGAPAVASGDHLVAVLAHNARTRGSEVAMRERTLGIWQEYTWREYLDQVLAAAAGLEALGVGPGDTVLVVGDNRPALYFGMLGAITLRAVPSPAYPDFTPDQLLGQLEREAIRFAIAEDQEQVDKLLDLRDRYDGLRWIVYDDPRGLAGRTPEGVIAFAELVGRGRARVRDEAGLEAGLLGGPGPDDIAVPLQCSGTTGAREGIPPKHRHVPRAVAGRAAAGHVRELLPPSGTTGAPKGVPLTHRLVLFAVRRAAAAGYLGEGEAHMAYMPIAWVGDFIFTIAAALALRFSVNIPEKQETVQHDL